VSEAKRTEGSQALRRFKRYPSYKESGVEWLGKIPASWVVSRADAFLRYEKYQVEPSSVSDELVFHYSIPSVQQTGDGVLEPPSEIDSAKLRIVGEKLLVSKLNPRKGVVLIASEKEVPTLCSTEFVPFQVRGCELRWALYLFLAESTRQRLSAVVRSATRSHQRAEIAEIVKIWHGVPPIPDQRAIAAFLDRETARINALVAKKERLIELLQEQRTALITRAVTKGLDPNVSTKDSRVEWLGEIPAHWEVKRLRHLVTRIEQGWSPDCENREADEDEWGVLKAGCVNRGVFIESEHKALPTALAPIVALEIAEGDLLMSRASGSRDLVGSVAVVPNCRPRLLLCDKVFRLHPRVDRADRYFLAYAMNSRVARSQIEVVLSGGSGLANNIAQDVVKDLVFGQPPLPEQRAIIAFLDAETTRIDALVAKVHDAIERIKELRTALISYAVTGKIDVREEVA
jgi:type I restriction enzyme, S subunit